VAPGHDGRAKAHYDGIVAFSQTDFTPDLKEISVPTLVMHGDDDQIVPYAGFRAAEREVGEEPILKTYKASPARHADHSSRDDQRRSFGVHQVLTALHAPVTSARA